MRWWKRPAPETPSDGGGEGSRENVTSALPVPATGIDPDWRERIELARRAYEEGKKLREGKPITFRTHGPLNLGDGSNV